jgi:purine-binding chemotaxis protein CheW
VVEEKKKIWLLIFQVGDEYFALPLPFVGEIVRYQPLKRLPRSLEFVEGLLDLRGEEVLPVVDLHKRLNLPAKGEGEGRILVAKVHNQRIGFLVDYVVEIMEFSESELHPLPEEMRVSFVRGVVRFPRKVRKEEGKEEGKEMDMAFVLDPNELFTVEEKVQLEKIRSRFLSSGKGAGESREPSTR